jgi:hypothetical protein
MGAPVERDHGVARLASPDRERLQRAHQRLLDAVAAMESLESRSEQAASEEATQRLAEAYTEVGAAEAELWRLREELLGWVRPSWTPRASAVADWFSDEDRVYDDVDLGNVS